MGCGRGDLVYDEGFLADSGKNLIKRIQIGSRLPKILLKPAVKTALMTKNSMTAQKAQNGSKMEEAMVEVAVEVMVVLMELNQ